MCIWKRLVVSLCYFICLFAPFISNRKKKNQMEKESKGCDGNSALGGREANKQYNSS